MKGTNEIRLDQKVVNSESYTIDHIPTLPGDETSPDEYGNEPRECVRCKREPAIASPVMTTNRGLDQVNQKLWLDPVCTGHDTTSDDSLIWQLFIYAGAEMATKAILVGRVEKEDAFEAIQQGPPQSLEDRIEEETDTEQIIKDMKSILAEEE